MTIIDEILAHNRRFVDAKAYESYATTKFPNKKIAVLTCMDTRLTELLPAALNMRNGDIKIIKTAGAVVMHPFGSVMRSILVAVYELEVEDILVIGHHDCGMQGFEYQKIVEKMMLRGVSMDNVDMLNFAGVDIEKWFRGFDNAEASVAETVAAIRRHPFVPSDVRVHGFMIHPETGKLDAL